MQCKAIDDANSLQNDCSFHPELKGKNILVLGMLGDYKKYIWDVAMLNGVNVTVLDTKDKDKSKKYGFQFIPMDCTDHSKDEMHAENIIDIVNSKGITLDGCLTFMDKYIPLAAILCLKLNLNCAEVEAVKIANSKHETQRALRSGEINSEYAKLCASKTFRIDCEDDIKVASTKIDFPAIMKPEYSSGSVYVKYISDLEHCIKEYKIFQQLDLKNPKNSPSEFEYGSCLVLMEYIQDETSYHGVNIIIFKGQLIGAFVYDAGPTIRGIFLEMSASMPTCLTKDQESQIIITAYTSCKGLGLKNGVFNVEIMMTPRGPKLIEINVRLPGFVSRNWIRTCYGVDLVLVAFLICCNMKPKMRKYYSPKCHIMGITCIPSVHKETLIAQGIGSTRDMCKKLNDLHETILILYTEIGASLDDDPDFELPFGNIAVVEKDLETAKERLLRVCEYLCLDTANYQAAYYLQRFICKEMDPEVGTFDIK